MNYPDAMIMSGGHICSLRNNKLTVEKQAHSWGITWDKDSVYATTNSSSINKFTNGQFERLKYGGQYLHQIYFHNGSIFVCNTKNDKIDQFKLATNKTIGYPQVGDHPKTNRLINSIWNDKQGHFWVVEHWKKQRASCVKKYDETFSNVIEFHDIGMCNHNVFIYNNILTTLNSYEGIIIQIDLASKEVSSTKFIPSDHGIDKNAYFLRGLAFNGEFYMIGVTVFHNDRGKRGTPGYLLIYDKNLKFIECLKAPAQVTDIRILKNDFAHNEIDFPGF